jgi:tetratricopeptide (TPR) repeat protein
MLSPGVTVAQDFEAVLRAPDDATLNIEYARAAVRQGELAIAASTLERVLINDPDRHGVRLFYAVVLYRLGDLQNAREQLRRLDAAPLTAAQRAEATAYSARIARAERATSVSGRLTAGLSYEQDAAGAYQTAFDLIGAPDEEDGLSSEISLSLDARRTLGPRGDVSLYGRGFLFDHTRLSGASVDFQRLDAEAGLRRDTRLTQAEAGVFVQHIRLEGEPQLTEVGLRADGRYRASNVLTVSGRLEVADQSYDEPQIDAVASFLGGDRGGERYLVGAGASLAATPRTTVSLGLDYTIKAAGYAPFGYEGPRLALGVQQRFDRGVWSSASVAVRWLDYDGADTFFLSGAVRSDTRTTARIAVGAPLAAFVSDGVVGDVRDRLGVEAAATYGRRDSNAPLADFDGLGAELRLIWRFGS